MCASQTRIPTRQAAAHHYSILIVDDSALVRRATCELFTREAEFEICAEASNGREAIEKAQQFRPDLIVLDLSMPVMNGLDAARELKGLMPFVPLILYSAFANPLLEQQARHAGVSAFISKSQAPATLVSTARALLTQKAA